MIGNGGGDDGRLEFVPKDRDRQRHRRSIANQVWRGFWLVELVTVISTVVPAPAIGAPACRNWPRKVAVRKRWEIAEDDPKYISDRTQRRSIRRRTEMTTVTRVAAEEVPMAAHEWP